MPVSKRQKAYRKKYLAHLANGQPIIRLVSFTEIGHRLGISRECATALYKSAIKKMRHAGIDNRY